MAEVLENHVYSGSVLGSNTLGTTGTTPSSILVFVYSEIQFLPP